jgi:hypothetical protein
MPVTTFKPNTNVVVKVKVKVKVELYLYILNNHATNIYQVVEVEVNKFLIVGTMKK